MKDRVVAVIQARMGSSRFPGKMTQKLGGHRIIDWVLLRMLRCERVDEIVLATSTATENSVLVDAASNCSVSVLSGSENDVLERFSLAASEFNAGHVVRICADNPFVDPVEVDRLVEFYLRCRPDYAFNHVPKQNNNYPDGLGGEILSAPLLQRIADVSHEARHREHVTLYVWDNADRYRIETISAPPEFAFPDVKLDVDTAEDLNRLRRIADALDISSSAQMIVDAYRSVYSQS